MAAHSSILAWRIPWTEEPGGPQTMELQRVGHDWSNLAHIHANVVKFIFIILRWICPFLTVPWFMKCFWEWKISHHVSSVAQLCPTLCDPMNWSTPVSLSITNSRSSLRLMSIESVMPSSHLILCLPLLLPPISRGNKEPLDESEREWKSCLKTQHSEN